MQPPARTDEDATLLAIKSTLIDAIKDVIEPRAARRPPGTSHQSEPACV